MEGFLARLVAREMGEAAALRVPNRSPFEHVVEPQVDDETVGGPALRATRASSQGEVASLDRERGRLDGESEAATGERAVPNELLRTAQAGGEPARPSAPPPHVASREAISPVDEGSAAGELRADDAADDLMVSMVRDVDVTGRATSGAGVHDPPPTSESVAGAASDPGPAADRVELLDEPGVERMDRARGDTHTATASPTADTSTDDLADRVDVAARNRAPDRGRPSSAVADDAPVAWPTRSDDPRVTVAETATEFGRTTDDDDVPSSTPSADQRPLTATTHRLFARESAVPRIAESHVVEPDLDVAATGSRVVDTHQVAEPHDARVLDDDVARGATVRQREPHLSSGQRRASGLHPIEPATQDDAEPAMREDVPVSAGDPPPIGRRVMRADGLSGDGPMPSDEASSPAETAEVAATRSTRRRPSVRRSTLRRRARLDDPASSDRPTRSHQIDASPAPAHSVHARGTMSQDAEAAPSRAAVSPAVETRPIGVATSGAAVRRVRRPGAAPAVAAPEAAERTTVADGRRPWRAVTARSDPLDERQEPDVPTAPVAVHIGRIDVRRNPPTAAAPAGPAPSRRPNLTLEQYLARRNGRRR